MKRILVSLYLILVLAGCDEKYVLDASFTMPTSLNSPSQIDIMLESTDPIVFSWDGGGATDGSYVTYSVLFDEDGGDFTSPLDTIPSDLGGSEQLTLTHAALNTIARNAGIPLESTGSLIWTVLASKGGETQMVKKSGLISITRGEGIDNIPDTLFLNGEGNESEGEGNSLFRTESEGVFVIYSLIKGSGKLELKGLKNGADFFYSYGDKLTEGQGGLHLQANKNPYRITVDFNTLTVSAEEVSAIRCVWGANYATIAELMYVGDGNFSASNNFVLLLDPAVPESGPPDWLSWVEERYYFIATIDGVELCWGRKDGISAEVPGENEDASFYELEEFAWSQWDHLWKMSHGLNNKTVDISIKTNKDNLMIHEFTNVR